MARLTTREVCALGRFSRASLWRRVQTGRLPKPIDHAREALFDEAAVTAALAQPHLPWKSSSTMSASEWAPPRSTERWLARQEKIKAAFDPKS